MSSPKTSPKAAASKRINNAVDEYSKDLHLRFAAISKFRNQIAKNNGQPIKVTAPGVGPGAAPVEHTLSRQQLKKAETEFAKQLKAIPRIVREARSKKNGVKRSGPGESEIYVAGPLRTFVDEANFGAYDEVIRPILDSVPDKTVLTNKMVSTLFRLYLAGNQLNLVKEETDANGNTTAVAVGNKFHFDDFLNRLFNQESVAFNTGPTDTKRVPAAYQESTVGYIDRMVREQADRIAQLPADEQAKANSANKYGNAFDPNNFGLFQGTRLISLNSVPLKDLQAAGNNAEAYGISYDDAVAALQTEEARAALENLRVQVANLGAELTRSKKEAASQ